MRTSERIFLKPLIQAGDALVGAYIVFEQLLLPIFKPAARLLVVIPPFVWIEQGASKLPPYAALIALAVPFAIAEPAKVFGLYLIGEEKVGMGVMVIIAAYLMSLLVVDRIYEGARPKLLRIRWFASVIGWLAAARDLMKERIRRVAPGRWIRAKVKTLLGT